MRPLDIDFAGSSPADTPPRLKRNFFLVAGISAILVIVLLGASFQRHEMGEAIDAAEARNAAMAQVFGNAVRPQFAEHFGEPFPGADAVRADPHTAGLDRALRDMSRRAPVSKIRVFNLDGVVVYSSVSDEIGEDGRANPAFVAARGGTPRSELVHRGSFRATEGELRNVHVVSSHIPIADDEGNIQAVFEIYTDITDTVAAIGREIWQLTAALGAIFTALFGALLLVVLNADRILQRLYRELKAARQLQARAASRQLDAFS